jgi:redox-sensitive bicupin YhaK (pirin superfamily)
MVGQLGGKTSPAPTYTPLVGAEVTLSPGAETTLDLEPSFEHGLLVAQGAVRVGGADGPVIDRNEMSYLGDGRREITLTADRAEDDTVLMLLGGEPFEEQLVMWWNFIGRSHEEIVEQREAWNGAGVDDRPERFGTVEGFDGDRLLAPPMPNTRLKPRGRSG